VALLPERAAGEFAAAVPDAEPLTGSAFVQDLAHRTGGTPATARWDAGVVLTPVAQLAGADLLTRILGRLPAGYALLFGRAELALAS
jgi:hypothetical protein